MEDVQLQPVIRYRVRLRKDVLPDKVVILEHVPVLTIAVECPSVEVPLRTKQIVDKVMDISTSALMEVRYHIRMRYQVTVERVGYLIRIIL